MVLHIALPFCLCRDMIATGCEDKNVRVYYLATSSDQPLKVFTGHLAKVFHVRWSPLREGILCSGSDDGWVQTNRQKCLSSMKHSKANKAVVTRACLHGPQRFVLCLKHLSVPIHHSSFNWKSVCVYLCRTVRIWDYTQDACINVLSGHKAPVRGLMWNTEVPFLLISGNYTESIVFKNTVLICSLEYFLTNRTSKCCTLGSPLLPAAHVVVLRWLTTLYHNMVFI